MSKHAIMATRKQRTPFGHVSLQSYHKHGRYYLRATGGWAAMRWLFKSVAEFERHGQSFRHVFSPAAEAITVERKLEKVCSAWQSIWDEQLQDHEVPTTTSEGSAKDSVDLSTLGQVFDHVLAQRQVTIAPSTGQRERYQLDLWRRELGNDNAMWALTKDSIVKARNAIATRVNATTTNDAAAVLKMYVRLAHAQNLASDECIKGIKPLKTVENRLDSREWWRSHEVKMALQCAEKDEHPVAATLLVATGCFLGLRVEEIIMLRWEDLDLEATKPGTALGAPVCHITPHDGWKPKNSKPRAIPIHSDLLKILGRYREPSGYLLKAQRLVIRQRKPSAVWAYRYDPRCLWDRLCERIRCEGGRAITMAGMRHTFASNSLMAGISEFLVGRWLGHRDGRMVSKHYGHLTSYHEAIDSLQYG